MYDSIRNKNIITVVVIIIIIVIIIIMIIIIIIIIIKWNKQETRRQRTSQRKDKGDQASDILLLVNRFRIEPSFILIWINNHAYNLLHNIHVIMIGKYCTYRGNVEGLGFRFIRNKQNTEKFICLDRRRSSFKKRLCLPLERQCKSTK